MRGDLRSGFQQSPILIIKIALAIIFPPLRRPRLRKTRAVPPQHFFCIVDMWIRGIIYTVYVVMKHDTDERHHEMLAVIQGSALV